MPVAGQDSAIAKTTARCGGRNEYPDEIHRPTYSRGSSLLSAEWKMSRSFFWFAPEAGDGLFPKAGLTEMQLTPMPPPAKRTKKQASRAGSSSDPFHWYFHSKRDRFRARRSVVPVHAHLCEVERLVSPKENHRDPTWFNADKARRRLRENRAPEFASEVSQ